MKSLQFQRTAWFIAIFLSINLSVSAQLKLPALISDGMVLQRDAAVKIWGWSSPNDSIQIKINTLTYSCLADDSGQWSTQLDSFKAGGPHQIEISNQDTSVVIKNVLFGDVWICSGQSNMELTMERASPLYPDEIANANIDQIKYFRVPYSYNFQKSETDLKSGKWIAVSPETIRSLSAVSYFFAKALYIKYQVPIGIINSSMGGSPIQAWMSEEALRKFPEHFEELQQFKSDSLIAAIEASDRRINENWHQKLNREDQGRKENWHQPQLNTSTWKTLTIPGYWSSEDDQPMNGSVWFRKEFTIDEISNTTYKLELGRIVDADSVFINGQFVGTTSYQYPPRRYEIPSTILRKGKNLISIRVISQRGKGGFVPDKAYQISNESDTIQLAGEWYYKIGTQMESLPEQTFIRWKAGGLYNGMLAPLTNYTAKGVVWYQGESNASHPETYKAMLQEMIYDWRSAWEQPELPFVIAQLPNYLEAREQPQSSNWALLREAQSQVVQLPNTGFSVNIDLGEWNDIHPLNKKDVADRLALVAEKIAYQEQSEFSGPYFREMKVKGRKVVLTFDHSAGMFASGSAPAGFAIAGSDQQFHWATAVIQNNQVILKSNKVKKPVAVRYAWADNPEKANIYNTSGLPMAPFRTDNWPK